MFCTYFFIHDEIFSCFSVLVPIVPNYVRQKEPLRSRSGGRESRPPSKVTFRRRCDITGKDIPFIFSHRNNPLSVFYEPRSGRPKPHDPNSLNRFLELGTPYNVSRDYPLLLLWSRPSTRPVTEWSTLLPFRGVMIGRTTDPLGTTHGTQRKEVRELLSS